MPDRSFETLDALPLAVLDALSDPVLIKDADLRLVWVNSAFEALFAVRRADVIGRREPEVFKDRLAVRDDGGDRRVLASGLPGEARETVLCNDGETRETLIRKSRVTLGEAQFLLGVMRDVTDMARLTTQLEQTAQALAEQSKTLRRLPQIDGLTGCLTRRALYDVAPDDLTGQGQMGALLMLEVDLFSAVSDVHGHAAGDAALIHFARLVRSNIRGSDSLARMGGEAFAVVLPGCNRADSRDIATRICLELARQPFEFEGKPIPLTVSIGGVHTVEAGGGGLDDLINQADAALSRAKMNGRNRVVWIE